MFGSPTFSLMYCYIYIYILFFTYYGSVVDGFIDRVLIFVGLKQQKPLQTTCYALNFVVVVSLVHIQLRFQLFFSGDCNQVSKLGVLRHHVQFSTQRNLSIPQKPPTTFMTEQQWQQFQNPKQQYAKVIIRTQAFLFTKLNSNAFCSIESEIRIESKFVCIASPPSQVDC